jgi:hypothetical protein
MIGKLSVKIRQKMRKNASFRPFSVKNPPFFAPPRSYKNYFQRCRHQLANLPTRHPREAGANLLICIFESTCKLCQSGSQAAQIRL